MYNEYNWLICATHGKQWLGRFLSLQWLNAVVDELPSGQSNVSAPPQKSATSVVVAATRQSVRVSPCCLHTCRTNSLHFAQLGHIPCLNCSPAGDCFPACGRCRYSQIVFRHMVSPLLSGVSARGGIELPSSPVGSVCCSSSRRCTESCLHRSSPAMPVSYTHLTLPTIYSV